MTYGAALMLLALTVTAAPHDGQSPYALMLELVAFGQRYAGAPRRQEAIALLERKLKAAGLAVERQSFTSPDPRDGRAWPMTNLVGRLRPEASCRFLLGSHFDTRHRAEEDPDPARRALPIPGANDGTSGVAVLLALAPRLPSLLPPGVGVDLILFDGEEMGYPGVGGYCAGSRRFAQALPGGGPRPRFGIILDMVCDEKGVYRYEANSLAYHRSLARALWGEGRRRAARAFVAEEGLSIIDDHVPLSEAGTPSVLVIGYNYPEWHTHADAPARCSRARLSAVERTLEDFVRRRAGDLLEGCRR